MTDGNRSYSHNRVLRPDYHEDLQLCLSRDPKKGFSTHDELRALYERRLVLTAIRELFSGLPRPEFRLERQVIRHLKAYYDTHGFAPYQEWLDPNGVRTAELWKRWRDA